MRLAKTLRYFKLLNLAVYCDGWTQVAFGEKLLPKLQIIFKMLPVVGFSFYSFLLAKCSMIMESVYEVEDTQTP